MVTALVIQKGMLERQNQTTYLKKVTLEVVSCPRIADQVEQKDACYVPRRQLLRPSLCDFKTLIGPVPPTIRHFTP